MSKKEEKKDKIAETQKRVDETVEIMKQNMTLAIQRGEDLEVVEDKSKELELNSHRFKLKSSALKKMMCCRNAKTTLVIVLIIIIVLIILIVGICNSVNC